jgi:DNA-directed RNA polymerase subunit RPC12/RpoP
VTGLLMWSESTTLVAGIAYTRFVGNACREEVRMRRYITPRRRDWMETLSYVTIYVTVMTLAFIIFWPLGFIVALLGLAMLIAWHRNTTAYRCQHCGGEFEIAFITDLISPHGIGREADGTTRAWKYLRCPHCGKRSRASALRIIAE